MDGFEPDAITVHLSVLEAMAVLCALRQYQPYWVTDSDVSPADQLAAIRCQIDSVIAKLRAAATPAGDVVA